MLHAGRIAGAALLAAILCSSAGADAALEAAAPDRGAPPPAGAAAAPPALEEIEVSAEAPGPQLWKVTRPSESGAHALWILGTLQPLPKDLRWRSREVAGILDHSQELILGGVNVSADIGPITALRLYLQWRRVRVNPDNQTLALILPPPLYARLDAVRARYDRNDREIERYQPMFAAARLFARAMRNARLSDDTSVQKTVEKLARARHLEIQRIKLEIDDPRGLLTLISATPQQAQITCLQTTLAHLETDVETIRQRAQAWATGDVDALRKLPELSEDAACWAMVSNAPRIRELAERARGAWVEAVRASLEHNSGTLALQSIDRLLGADGLLETLRAQGYTIAGP